MSPDARRRRIRWAAATLLLPVLVVLWSAVAAKRVSSQAREKITAALAREGLVAELPEDLDWNWRGVIHLGPVRVAPSAQPDAVVADIGRISATPQWSALLTGSLVLDRVRLTEVDVDVSAALDFARSRAGKGQDSADVGGLKSGRSTEERIRRLEWESLVLSFTREGRRFHSEPLTGSLVPRRGRDGGAGFEAEVRFESGGRVTASGERQGGEVSLLLEAEGVRLAPPWLLAALGQPSERLDGKVEGKFSLRRMAAGPWESSLELHATDVWVNDARFGSKLGPWAFSVEGPLRWNPERRRADATLTVGLGERRVPLRLAGQAALSGTHAFEAKAELPLVDFGALVQALPAGVAPPSPIYGVRGELGGWVRLKGPLHRRENWEMDARFNLEPLRAALEATSQLNLKGGFTHVVRQGSGKGRTLTVGPTNPHFARLEDIPKPLVSALLLSEDSGFYAHQGFDLRALERHLLRPETDKGVLRGGSTLTQQLAKNLFLSPERTYARKVREALSTLVLEAAATKPRLLEIYLNIIEWGPGIYGIGEAAQHYFRKRPEALSLKEAIFLATIVPSPVKYHGYCSRGAVTPIWEQRMRDLLFKMLDAGVITEEAHDEADQTTLVFAHAPLGVEEDEEDVPSR